MGYHPNRGLLHANEELLAICLQVVMSKEKQPIAAASPSDLSSLHYTLNRVLNSADVFTDFQGGKYKGLRAIIKLKQVNNPPGIEVQPRAADFKVVRKSWKDALAELREDLTSTIKMIEFYPSPDFDPSDDNHVKQFALQLLEAGWVLHHNSLMRGEDESITFGVERKEVKQEQGGFNILNRS